MTEKQKRSNDADQNLEQPETQKSKIALREEEILQFWNDNDIFQKSVEKEAPNGRYVFYDGPPFATGLPHHGHLLASTIKDAVPRYWTMKGYRVKRVWGWDTHGLPIENIVEKELEISGKKQIEEIGIAKFSEKARSKVLEYADGWRDIVNRLGRWVEYDNSYKTMDTPYMESVWWTISQVNQKGLLYEGHKVLPYCPRCETPVANAEIQMDNSYKDVTEDSVYIKFPIVGEENTYALAWTTTPWTLPGNSALYIHKDFEYVKVQQGDDFYYLAKDRVDQLEGEYEVVADVAPDTLIGKTYTPLYNYFEGLDEEHYHIDHADFVTLEQGSGIVHSAIVHGETDFERAQEQGLALIKILDERGHFLDKIEVAKGEFFKKGEKTVTKDLQEKGLVYKVDTITHSYPHCFRCETPLYYSALSAWFINIQKVKQRLVEKNQEINWIPGHLKDGRFAKSVEGAPDWNISRNRFWATPLPIWKRSKDDQNPVIIGSLDELKKYTKKSGNTYIKMRHGHGEHNDPKTEFLSCDNEVAPSHLTEEGKKNAQKTAQEIAQGGVDVIIASPLIRTQETAKILAQAAGLSEDAIVTDDRITEVNWGDFNGKSFEEFRGYYASKRERFDKALPNGETWSQVKQRTAEFLYDLEEKYQNKRIVIVTHGAVAWMLDAVRQGLDVDQTATALEERRDILQPGEFLEFDFVPLSHNKNYELDLHRPYIDDVQLVDENGEELTRIPEVVDCWVESGSMPFAQHHYPFENKEYFEERHPAQFVTEYIAQTRTWFYYMHALSVILFDKIPFENVVTTGTIMSEDGQKMSKSKRNFTDPTMLFGTYGVDAMRMYMLMSPLMKSEHINFSDKGVDEVMKKLVMRLNNVVAFYEMYGGGIQDVELKIEDCKNTLDLWILTRLHELHKQVEVAMEQYEIDQATRPIIDFLDDLSTWYVRRSRDRFKSEGEDKSAALLTTRFVLLELSKIIAPFTPFLAEDVYRRVGGKKESVHLEDWTENNVLVVEEQEDLLKNMEEARHLVTLALEKRASEGIKVRQPLQTLRVKSNMNDALAEIIKDEVNVKEVIVDGNLKEDIELDFTLSDELREEGNVRDLIRFVQNLRKQAKLQPEDQIKLTLSAGKDMVEKYKDEITRVAGVSEYVFKENDGDGVVLGDQEVFVSLEKLT